MNNPVNLNDPTGHVWKCTGANDDHCSDDGQGQASGMVSNRGRGVRNLVTKDIGDFYVGPNAPKNLTEYEAEAYSGHGMSNTPPGLYSTFGDGYGLLDDEVDYLGRRNNRNNVFVSANYELLRNGSINVLSLTITNTSDSRLFIKSVLFTATGNPMNQLTTNSCNNLDQCYSPNPPRLLANGNDSQYFETIEPKSIDVVPLAPSGYPFNPNNHFGPQGIQAVDIRVNFMFTIQPGFSFVGSNLIP